jgi:hypothetical protein
MENSDNQEKHPLHTDDKISTIQTPDANGRRKVLQKILMGSGAVGVSAILPSKWTKPIIDTIIVPTHAQGSITTTTPAPTTTPVPTTTIPPVVI